eukprot:NODE_7972_length_1533_cov_11.178521.p1 GENE.NODE_7972_length_1533_cov_11.178521~~NODE_7972_length_1533_cov_11.178521.p1  ORF type:complete len:300 (-),score=18.60 NODE_7972_length_1533_cov_11.178521:583-1482(-)
MGVLARPVGFVDEMTSVPASTKQEDTVLPHLDAEKAIPSPRTKVRPAGAKVLPAAGAKLTYKRMSKTGSMTMKDIVRKCGLSSSGYAIRREFSPLAVEDHHNFVIGTIRNPCEWYVSLYTYGATDHGLLHLQTPQRLKRPNDQGTFKKWLIWACKSKVALDRDVLKGPGLMSARFARAFTYVTTHLPASVSINFLRDKDLNKYEHALETFERSNVDCWVHMENYAEDTRACLRRYEKLSGIPVNWKRVEKLLKRKKINTSAHKSCSFFFDEEAEALVRSTDPHMFRILNYTTCCDPPRR